MTGASGKADTEDAIWFPSQNYGPRKSVARPDLIVLHYTAMTTAEGARDWLCNPEAEVSAHYVLAEDGRLWQLVPEAERAWHAGRGAWGDATDVNSRSIGIEIANTGSQPFSAPQMTQLERLLAGMMQRWSIVPERVIGHSDCSPGRKIDPGRRFDWRRLALGGLSIWPDAAQTAKPEQFWRDAAKFGYRWDEGNEAAVLDAFRSRFRPAAQGALSAEDAGMMAALANQWPVLRDALA
ncbi:N-acetylmuramoyl-L-alanine amidase [Thalassococcus lentus]|uniref:N-acetylmuramoyl-L-alanine amidase n=1 Tax=Thalassococcus lentus TaxID=1210524 RepID=A0ABT4XVP2_9RHOB|nr:N-acetylmuramoyl-L-alanine amidase [Thalassococcus lentus]MDA7425878.1 N-acetylmuramoyl-L-alanine amidase [Thalassococcus lentus]